MQDQGSQGLRASAAGLYFVLLSGLLIACVLAGRVHELRAPLGVELAYALTHAALLFAPLQLLLLGIERLPWLGPRARAGLGASLVSLAATLLFANLMTLRLLGLMIEKSVVGLAQEPGFFVTIGIGRSEWGVMIAGFAAFSAGLVVVAIALSRWGPRARARAGGPTRRATLGPTRGHLCHG